MRPGLRYNSLALGAMHGVCMAHVPS